MNYGTEKRIGNNIRKIRKSRGMPQDALAAKLQRVAREVDPDCFIIISRVSEVWGRGFPCAKKGPRQD